VSEVLEALYSGRLSKHEVLGNIRDSAEARSRGVSLEGLDAAVRMRRWRKLPLVGRLIGIVQYILRLPTLARNIENLETALYRRDREFTSSVSQWAGAIQDSIATIQARQVEAISDMRKQDLERRRNVRGLIEHAVRSLAFQEAMREAVSSRAGRPFFLEGDGACYREREGRARPA
jgi:hypothetical protein